MMYLDNSKSRLYLLTFEISLYHVIFLHISFTFSTSRKCYASQKNYINQISQLSDLTKYKAHVFFSSNKSKTGNLICIKNEKKNATFLGPNS